MSAKDVKKKKKKNKKFKTGKSMILAFLLTIVLIYLSVTAIETTFKISDTSEKIDIAQAQLDTITAENENTENLLINANENDIIERIARERLGYVFPDEKVYYDVNN